MTSSFETRSHKPARFGEINILNVLADSEIETYRASFCGIDLYIDDKELAEIFNNLPRTDVVGYGETSGLVYLTKQPLPLYGSDNEPLITPMNPNLAGEMYTDYSLRSFGFSGIPSFGTISHIMYGIRTLDKIQEGVVGLHAAVVYDRELDGCHLLVGPSKAGKSTLGRQLEHQDPARYTLLGDDWAEVYPETMEVKIASPVFATSETAEEPLFTSFGKSYYRKDTPVLPTVSRTVRSIIELHHEPGISAEDFMIKSFSAVPFVMTDDYSSLQVPELHAGNASSHLVQLVAHKMASYKGMYGELWGKYGLLSLVNDHSRSVEEMALKIHNELR